jgi:hypothetical protein
MNRKLKSLITLPVCACALSSPLLISSCNTNTATIININNSSLTLNNSFSNSVTAQTLIKELNNNSFSSSNENLNFSDDKINGISITNLGNNSVGENTATATFSNSPYYSGTISIVYTINPQGLSSLSNFFDGATIAYNMSMNYRNLTLPNQNSEFHFYNTSTTVFDYQSLYTQLENMGINTNQVIFSNPVYDSTKEQ